MGGWVCNNNNYKQFESQTLTRKLKCSNANEQSKIKSKKDN